MAGMARPPVYDESDPYLAELRRICLALPEAVEVEAWGRPTFRAGKKIFAVFTVDGDEHPAVIFKPDGSERDAISADDRVYSPPYFGPAGWLALDFAAGPVDWTEVAELVESSYRLVALKRMITELDRT